MIFMKHGTDPYEHFCQKTMMNVGTDDYETETRWHLGAKVVMVMVR